MEQPTKEQIQKFWEWCGFSQVPIRVDDGFTETEWKVELWWKSPKVDSFCRNTETLPPIDLNNLFKYAVPRLHSLYLDTKEEYVPNKSSGQRIFTWEVVMVKGGARSAGNDSALALFWAIWQVIEGEKHGS